MRKENNVLLDSGVCKKMTRMHKMMQKVWRLRYAVSGALVAGVNSTNTLAATPKPVDADDYTFFQGKSNGIFDGVTNTVRETGASAYGLIMSIGVICILVGLAIGLVGVAVHKDRQKKMENKEHIGWAIFAGGFLFAIPGIIALLYGIGKTI